MTQMPASHTTTVTGFTREDGQLAEVTLYEGSDVHLAMAAIDDARAQVQTGALEVVEVFEHRRRHIDGACRCIRY